MKRFFGQFLKATTNHSEKEQVEKGLFVGKEPDEGYYEVVHDRSGEILARRTTKQDAVLQANTLATFADWSKIRDLEHLQEENKRAYTQVVYHRKAYTSKKVFNGLYLNSQDQNGNVQFKVYTPTGEKRIKGKLVVRGLAVSENEQGRGDIVHIPTGRIMSSCSTKTKALRAATVMKTLVNWNYLNLPELIVTTPLLQSYLKEIKQAVEEERQIPDMSKELSMELLYMSNPKLKERKTMYQAAYKELHAMYGMDAIKEQVDTMLNQLTVDQQLRNAGIKEDKQTLHTIFYGPAGTGKTQVARIIAKLFYAMGYLDKPEIVETTADNMIAGYVGQTAEKAQQKINEAMGGVLFIDEAYGFGSASMSGERGNFGDDAIRVLLAAAENHRDKLCIILAGYENEMNQMMKMNEGLESRFPKGNRFYFRDYTPKQLTLITRDMLKASNYIITSDVEKEMERVITMVSKNGAVNGNARWARNFKEDILDQHKKWIRESKPTDLRTITFETLQIAAGLKKKAKPVEGLEEVKNQALSRIHTMIGLTDLKKNLEELMAHLDIQKKKFEKGLTASRPNMHMIFAGPPGTGKTTVAEHVGQFLKGAGMLSNGHFIQISGTDLTKGNPSTAVESIINKSIGGVLFIDEAYSLCNDPNGKKAVDLLIQEMENKRDDLVVILAGYENEMKQLLNMNPGFESRVVYTFDFPYYTAEEIVQIVQLELKKRTLTLTPEADIVFRSAIRQLQEKYGKIEGNGRWARNFVEKLEIKQNSRIVRNNISDFEQVTKEDIINTFQSL